MQSKILTAKLDSWQSRLKAAYNLYMKSNNEVAWVTAQDKLGEDAEKLNKEVVALNLKLPSGVAHRPLIVLRKAVERLSRS